MHGYYIKTMVKEKLEDQGILKCLLSQTININFYDKIKKEGMNIEILLMELQKKGR